MRCPVRTSRKVFQYIYPGVDPAYYILNVLHKRKGVVKSDSQVLKLSDPFYRAIIYLEMEVGKFLGMIPSTSVK